MVSTLKKFKTATSCDFLKTPRCYKILCISNPVRDVSLKPRYMYINGIVVLRMEGLIFFYWVLKACNQSIARISHLWSLSSLCEWSAFLGRNKRRNKSIDHLWYRGTFYKWMKRHKKRVKLNGVYSKKVLKIYNDVWIRIAFMPAYFKKRVNASWKVNNKKIWNLLVWLNMKLQYHEQFYHV